MHNKFHGNLILVFEILCFGPQGPFWPNKSKIKGRSPKWWGITFLRRWILIPNIMAMWLIYCMLRNLFLYQSVGWMHRPINWPIPWSNGLFQAVSGYSLVCHSAMSVFCILYGQQVTTLPLWLPFTSDLRPVPYATGCCSAPTVMSSCSLIACTVA